MTDSTGADEAPVLWSVSTWQQPMPPSCSPARAAVVEDIARTIRRLGGGRLRVSVDGLTAAGKTSFGHELARQLSAGGRPVLRACLDDFKRPWRDRHRYDRESGPGYYRNAFDYETLRDLLLGSEAESVHRDRYWPAERLYLAEVEPRRLADVVIDNSDLDVPRVVSISSTGRARTSEADRAS